MVWYDIASLLHAPSLPPAPAPQVGARLTGIPDGLGTFISHPILSPNVERYSAAEEYLPPHAVLTNSPTIIAAVRHCGCPFAEAEVRSLARLSNANPTLHVIVICMSAPSVAEPWFSRIGGDDFTDKSRITLLPDPTRSLYASLGFGTLPWGGLFSRAMISSLLELKKKGIVNTETGEGSYRWQNSGGIAVDEGGVVRWCKIAEHAGDMCDYEAAVGTLLN